MLLSSGTRLGPYEIVSAIGAGGMGEVYRARDSRLARDVAIKVLPATFSSDPDRLRRFEQEARSAAALNHPNIVNVYDIGTHERSPYLVTELLEGETLRQRIQAGALPARKATDVALQVTRGLAAAHEKGIVHRDLKPENIFVTKDGRVKILDFGLAKLTRPEDSSAQGDAATVASRTEPGMVMGTAGYMSPEQVRGRPTDPRCDIFSLGTIVYEMVSGARAFHGETAADTMSAILKEEPPALAQSSQNIPPGLQRIVEHSLEKDPGDRFQSARDLAFALEALSGASGASAAVSAVAAPADRSRYRSALLAFGLGVLLTAVALLLGGRIVAGPPAAPPQFHQLTFRKGSIAAARFTADGKTIVYSASWEGKPSEVFLARLEGTESLPLGVADSDLLAVSPGGELAVRLTPRRFASYLSAGTLARTMLTGGMPREVLNDVQWADWAPDGRLAVVRDVGGRNRLEYPIDHPLFETAGWIGNPRFSADGQQIAFLHHRSRSGDPGSVVVVDLAGHARTLSDGFVSAHGLAWSPAGDEIWFTATRAGSARALYAVSRSGKERLLSRVPGILTLHDVARDGRVLLTRDEWRLGIIVQAPGAAREQDTSWMDFSAVRDLSPDGKLLLFDESGEAGGSTGVIFLRKTDGSPPVRLGNGVAQSLSADGKWVLGVTGQGMRQFLLLPTGVGETKLLPASNMTYDSADWLPDGERFLFAASTPGHAARVYLQDIAGGEPRPVTPEGASPSSFTQAVSPDGKSVLVKGGEGKFLVCAVEAGACKPVAGVEQGEVAFGWTRDGRAVYVYFPAVPAKVYEVDLASGQRRLWRELDPPDPVGVNFLRPPHISSDGKSYAYNYNRTLSELYLVEGLK